jgi:hypothetical protein
MSAATLLLPVSGDEAAIRSLIESVGRTRLRVASAPSNKTLRSSSGPPTSNVWDERWETPLAMQWRNLKVDVAGGLAHCHGFLRVSATKKGTDRPMRSWKCVSVQLQRMKGEWRLIHVHFRSVLQGRNPA